MDGDVPHSTDGKNSVNGNAALGLVLSDDLIFASRIAGTARGLGLEVKQARTVEQLLEFGGLLAPTCVIVDLAFPGLELKTLMRRLGKVCSVRPRVVAYGAHVDPEGLRAARAAGCDPVLPRSKFVEMLSEELPRWLEAAQAGE
jgi:CheY-like chemotaxis protein